MGVFLAGVILLSAVGLAFLGGWDPKSRPHKRAALVVCAGLNVGAGVFQAANASIEGARVHEALDGSKNEHATAMEIQRRAHAETLEAVKRAYDATLQDQERTHAETLAALERSQAVTLRALQRSHDATVATLRRSHDATTQALGRAEEALARTERASGKLAAYISRKCPNVDYRLNPQTGGLEDVICPLDAAMSGTSTMDATLSTESD